jgi:hypothetical protein
MYQIVVRLVEYFITVCNSRYTYRSCTLDFEGLINSTDTKVFVTSVEVTSRVVFVRVINRVVWWADVRSFEKHPASSCSKTSIDHYAYITR